MGIPASHRIRAVRHHLGRIRHSGLRPSASRPVLAAGNGRHRNGYGGAGNAAPVLVEPAAGKVRAGALARLWEACGIDRGIERAYAAIVIAVTGGWLAAAIGVGPVTRPLPLVAGIATVILGIPWWFHRRRRAKARVEKTISAWPGVAENAGLAGSEILSVVVDAWGWTARVLLRKGATIAQVISKIPALESNLGLRPGSMRVFPDDKRADRFIMRVIENDPHAAPVPWPGPSIASVTKVVEIGLSEDGRPVRVLIVRRNVLIGGNRGRREIGHPQCHHRHAGRVPGCGAVGRGPERRNGTPAVGRVP